MKNLLLLIFASLSALLLLLTLAVWCHTSYGDNLNISQFGLHINIERGGIELKRLYQLGDPIMEEDWIAGTGLNPATMRRLPRHTRRFAGFSYTTGQECRGDGGDFFRRHPRPASYWELIVPLWVIVLLTAPLPLLARRRFHLLRRQRLRIRRGLCPNCAYDLCATPEECPECGHVPSAASPPADPSALLAPAHPTRGTSN